MESIEAAAESIVLGELAKISGEPRYQARLRWAQTRSVAAQVRARWILLPSAIRLSIALYVAGVLMLVWQQHRQQQARPEPEQR